MHIKLRDGSRKEIPEGSNGASLAKQLKKKLNGAPLVLRLNGEFKDLTTILYNGDEVEILTFADDEGRDIFWHSSAHLLAQAIIRLYPDAKPTIGPAVDNGFYYDFADLNLQESEFLRIEEEMQKIVKERLTPERIEYKNKAEALKDYPGNKFKKEMIEELEEGLSAYRQGDFIDLCRGPHIPGTHLIQAFKVLKTSGAYWRGDAKNDQLTRVYAVSFPDKKMLSKHMRFLEEAKKRDHRVVGKKLDLFSFHEEAPGMAFIHPKGMIVWDELLRFEKELQTKAGYFEIKTPVMLAKELWETSGHWDYYREHMYTSLVDDREYAIKPMNCPGCMLYYKTNQFSYKQLPLRIAETGMVHRHEMSGALSGLFRVRSFYQDDAHIFMRPEDLKSEILNALSLAEKMYAAFELDFHMELSTRPEKSIGSDNQWEMATSGLRDALVEAEYAFEINEGDGAFYGPKIDLHVKDVLGRTWQCGTFQLDMSLPERFDLVYDGHDGSKQRPIMIHRAIYGSIERFFGILIEHYGGRFPLWLSPVHARILTVADRHHEYANQVHGQLAAADLRAEVDESSESINKKVRNAQLDQVNYILVVGDRELEAGNVSVRTRENDVLGARELKTIINSMKNEYSRRSSKPLVK